MIERPSERPGSRTSRGTGEYLRPRAGRTEIDRTTQPSLIDRLTDAEPDLPRDRALTPEDSAAAFRASVQCDVEWLLNTRRSIVPSPDGCTLLPSSVHEFGLPDMTGLSVGTAEGRESLRQFLQDALERFEPRLEGPIVRLLDVGTHSEPLVRFQVEALLRMDPSPQHVLFDTMLEVAKSEYVVQDDSASTPAR
jgi:type VI secretion system protein ImpF